MWGLDLQHASYAPHGRGQQPYCSPQTLLISMESPAHSGTPQELPFKFFFSVSSPLKSNGKRRTPILVRKYHSFHYREQIRLTKLFLYRSRRDREVEMGQ
jgi:hypothetical protein